jgi:hypothetical protein
MNLSSIKGDFKSRVCEQIDIEQEGEDRFFVTTPFRFGDGDHYVIVLKKEEERWILTDEAHTLMHLSYWMDDKALEEGAIGNRKEIMDSSLSSYFVQNRGGELIIPVNEARFGDALFNFIQALTKISDISYLSKERVRSTFVEDLMEFLKKNLDNTRLSFNWNDKDRDPNRRYLVDCRINTMKRPLFVYGVPNDAKAHLATIALLRFDNWGIPFRSLGVFEDQTDMDPKPVARFTDAVEKSFSSLHGNEKDIIKHINRVLKIDVRA